MKLASMKMNAEERKEQMPTTADAKEQQYPYGLRLDLDDGTLGKLGLTKLPPVGATLVIYAHAKVVSKGSNQSEGDKDEEQHLALQITEMACEVPGSPEEKLYQK